MPISVRCKLPAILLWARVPWHVSAEKNIEGVVDIPHFARTSGNFTLKAWLEDKTMLEQPVPLTQGQTQRVDSQAQSWPHPASV